MRFPREINLYSDAKLLKTHSIGKTPINEKNVHCDWSTTRVGADSVEWQVPARTWKASPSQTYLYTRRPTLDHVVNLLHCPQNYTILTWTNSLYQTRNAQARHRHTVTDIQLQLKCKFTQLKLLNCSNCSIRMHAHSQLNESTTKNYQPTGN